MAELSKSYWHPIYAFMRRRGLSNADACDATQDYFVRLIEGTLLLNASRARGRFRALLRRDCGYFLADRRDREGAARRGGGARHLSLDAERAEARYLAEPIDDEDAEAVFDRAWAMELLSRAYESLAVEATRAGRGIAFELLRDLLAPYPPPNSPARIAAEAGTTVGAVRAAAARLRRRFRERLRAEVAATLDAPSEADVDEEVFSLFQALGRRGGPKA